MIERLVLVVLLAASLAAIGVIVRDLVRKRANRARGRIIPPELLPDSALRGVSILYFFGTHCAPCHQQDVVLDRLREHAGTAVVRVDAAEHVQLARSLGVLSVPATAVLDRGQVRTVNIGHRSLRDLQAQIGD